MFSCIGERFIGQCSATYTHHCACKAIQFFTPETTHFGDVVLVSSDEQTSSARNVWDVEKIAGDWSPPTARPTNPRPCANTQGCWWTALSNNVSLLGVPSSGTVCLPGLPLCPCRFTPCVTFRLVVAPLRGPGRSPVLPFACCVGSLLSVGRCGQCSCWCRFRVRGAQ